DRLLGCLGIPARVSVVPADEAPSPRACDALIIGWSSYAHIQGWGRRVALLRTLRAAASPRAPLLLSFHARDGVAFSFATVMRVANLLRAPRGAPPVEQGDTLGRFFIHMFTRDEIERELDAGG